LAGLCFNPFVLGVQSASRLAMSHRWEDSQDSDRKTRKDGNSQTPGQPN
jgi:hypothetical protein